MESKLINPRGDTRRPPAGAGRRTFLNRLDCPADSHQTNVMETHPWLTCGPQVRPFKRKVRRSKLTRGPEAGVSKRARRPLHRQKRLETMGNGPARSSPALVRPRLDVPDPGVKGHVDKVCQHPRSSRRLPPHGTPSASHDVAQEALGTCRQPHREAQ